MGKESRKDYTPTKIDAALNGTHELCEVLCISRDLVLEQRKEVNNLLESYLKSQDTKLTKDEQLKFLTWSLRNSIKLNCELFAMFFNVHMLFSKVAVDIDDIANAYSKSRLEDIITDDHKLDMEKLRDGITLRDYLMGLEIAHTPLNPLEEK